MNKENLATRDRSFGMAHRERPDLYQFAAVQLAYLIEAMEFNDIDQDSREYTLADNTKINIFHSHGLSYVDISVPEIKEEDLEKAVLEAIPKGRFFIEVNKPGFSWIEDKSHDMYWLFNKETFDLQLIKNLQVVIPGPISFETITRAIEVAFSKLKIIMGDKVVLIPFDFEQVEKYYPSGMHSGKSGVWSAGGWRAYREAKSFVTEGKKKVNGETVEYRNEYIGYNRGALIDSTRGELLVPSFPGIYKKFLQFNKVGDYLNWFGISERKEDGAPLVYDLNSLSMKVISDEQNEDAGDIELLGGFTHPDYMMRMPGDNSFTHVDTHFGNIMTALGPAARVPGLSEIKENIVYYHVYGGVPESEMIGYAEESPRGVHGQCHTVLGYQHDGGSPDGWEYKNVEGKVSTGHTGYIWGKDESERGGCKLTATYPFLRVEDVFEDDYSLTMLTSLDIGGDIFFTKKAFANKMDRKADSGETTVGFYEGRVLYSTSGALGRQLCWGGLGLSVPWDHASSIGGWRSEYIRLAPQQVYQETYNRSFNLQYGVGGFSYVSKERADSWLAQGYLSGPLRYVENMWVNAARWYFNEEYCDTPTCLDQTNGLCGWHTMDNSLPGCTTSPPSSMHNGFLRENNSEENVLSMVPFFISFCALGYHDAIHYKKWVYSGIPKGPTFPPSSIGASPRSHSEDTLRNTSDLLTPELEEIYNLAKRAPSTYLTDAYDYDSEGRDNAEHVAIRNLDFGENSIWYTLTPTIFIYLGGGKTWELKGTYITERARNLRNVYAPEYGLLDDRACSGDMFLFVGTSKDLQEDAHSMRLDNWHITLFPENSEAVPVEDEIFSLLELGELKDQILDMGMF